MDIIKNKPDKTNGKVLYYDNIHSYVDKDDNVKYVSVTTLIGKYCQEFDEDFWSSYKALEEIMQGDFKNIKSSLLATKKFNNKILDKFNIDKLLFIETKNKIIKSYDEKRNTACERGTKIHADFENSFYTKDKHKLDYISPSHEFICKKDYYQLDLERAVYPEFLISVKSSDGLLRVAGQIDLLIKNGNELWIHDFKTNREIQQKSYYDRSKKSTVNMKYPLNNLMDCNYMHYTLQLSLYAYLLQQINPEFVIKELKIIHIDHDGKRTDYELEYLKNDVERMLKHYKKSIKIEYELNKDK